MQLAHISTVLRLGITETVGTALDYRRSVGQKIQEKDRKRTASIDSEALLAKENFTMKEQAKKEIHLASESELREKEKSKIRRGREKGDSSASFRGNAESPPRCDYYRMTENRQNDRRDDRSRSRQKTVSKIGMMRTLVAKTIQTTGRRTAAEQPSKTKSATANGAAQLVLLRTPSKPPYG